MVTAGKFVPILLCGVLSVGSAWGQTSVQQQGEPPFCPAGLTPVLNNPTGHRDIATWTCEATFGTPQSGHLHADDIGARLDRIEAMLRAICEHRSYASSKPDCPKETKP